MGEKRGSERWEGAGPAYMLHSMDTDGTSYQNTSFRERQWKIALILEMDSKAPLGEA